ncbi:MAG: HAMP domain-containing histidine kinase, partial [Eubacterium sp.]|nr:HAMP domain-containing histidine kinase [Eubacterium sp.]
ILFLITYTLSSAITFGQIKNSKNNDIFAFEQKLSEYTFNDVYSDKTADELAAYYTDCFYGFNWYAWGVALYNENGEITAQSGSHITISNTNSNDEIIFLDKYLTSEIKEKINSFRAGLISPGSCDITELDYIENAGKKIPVSFTLVDMNDKNVTLKIVLSNEKNAKTISCDSYKNLSINLIDIDEQSYLHKSYIHIYDVLSKADIEETFKTKSGSGWSGSEEMYSTRYIDLLDGEYVLVISAVFHPVIETLQSENFKSVMFEQTTIFIIVYLVAVISLSTYFKKKKQLEDAKTAFTSAAAHELKTPLSVIENQCECIMENVAPEKNAEYINSIYAEALRMNKLVASLLQYNRLASADHIKMEKCRLDEIVHSEIEKYQTYFSTKNIRLETEVFENAQIKCNAELVALVIDNYLSNAVKHTANGNTINISLIKNNNSYRFSVYNEGKNIPDEYKEMLFNVLYKTDKSRNRDDNSTGMGLAICKEILEQHKFKYGYTNKRDGVEFYFTT